MEDNDFEKPSKEDLGGTLPKPWKTRIQYAAGKTDAVFLDPDWRKTVNFMMDKEKLGFFAWDKSKGLEIPLYPLTIFHVASFIRIEGNSFDAKKNKTEYWSNYVRDSSAERFVVRSSRSKEIVAEGLYSEIKDQLPAGARFTIVLVVYEPSGDELCVMPLSFILQEGIKNALALAIGCERKEVKLFNLADKAIFGFKLSGFEPVNSKGGEYSSESEVYFMPTFVCGKVRATNTSIIGAVEARRKQVNEWYESTRLRHEAVAPEVEPEAAQTDDLPY